MYIIIKKIMLLVIVEFKIETGNIYEYKYYILKFQYLYSLKYGAKFSLDIQ
jgi:hypothetical protein